MKKYQFKSKMIAISKYICIGLIVFLTIALFTLGCSNDKQTLHIYSWSDYFDPDLISQFEKENNCNVVIDTFDSNEAMYAKLKAGATGYDIYIPSSYLIPTLRKDNLITKLDYNLIPNVIENFNHDLDDQILDKNFEWSVPYACTYTGIMYLKSHLKDTTSWKVLANQEFKGKISLLDDIRETIGIGLFLNGYSLNSTNKSEILAAAKTIVDLKDNIRKFDAESYKLEVANKSTWIGHGYSSDAVQIILEDNRTDIGFALPDEGFTIAWDEFVVSSTSLKYELAHKFINMFYDVNVSYQNMMYICALMGNKYAFAQLDENYKNLLMPQNFKNGELLKGFEDVKILEYYNEAWDLIKTFKKQ